MNIHDATEQAYRNGKEDAKEKLLEKLMEIKTQPGTESHQMLSVFIAWVRGL